MKRIGTAVFAAAFLAGLFVSTGFAAAEEEKEEPKVSAYDKFRRAEMEKWRDYSRGLSRDLSREERSAKIKEYALGMVERYEAFRDGKEGKPFAFDADSEILTIYLALIEDEEALNKFVASRKEGEYRTKLQIELAKQYAQYRKEEQAKTLIDKILADTKEKHPKLHAQAERIAFQIDPVGKMFPEFPEFAKDTDGKPIRIADYKGKVVLVDFWASWCGPCIAELPNVVKAYKEYHPKGFEIIGVSLDHSEDDMKAALDKYDMTWRQYYDGKGWQNEVSTKYGVSAIPATYLVGPDGKVVSNLVRGPVLQKTLKSLLAKK